MRLTNFRVKFVFIAWQTFNSTKLFYMQKHNRFISIWWLCECVFVVDVSSFNKLATFQSNQVFDTQPKSNLMRLFYFGVILLMRHTKQLILLRRSNRFWSSFQTDQFSQSIYDMQSKQVTFDDIFKQTFFRTIFTIHLSFFVVRDESRNAGRWWPC